MKLFDCDQHINDREEDLIRRAGLARKRVMPTDGWHREKSEISSFAERLLKDRRAYFDYFGVEYAALYPTRSLSHAMIREPEVSLRILEAYNDYLLECANEMPGLLPVALASVHDIDYTVSCLPAYRERGFAGVLLLPHGHHHLFGERRFFKLYAACAESCMPVVLHPNSFGAIGGENCTTFEEFHTLTFPLAVIKQFASMMFSGVFERFPDLSFLMLEAGAGWLPFWLDRMDNEYDMRSRDVLIESRPSEILGKASVFLSCTGFDRDISVVDAMLGNGGVVWGSDYPHWDSHIPEERAGIFEGCPESLRERVFSANGRRCFHRGMDGAAA